MYKLAYHFLCSTMQFAPGDNNIYTTDPFYFARVVVYGLTLPPKYSPGAYLLFIGQVLQVYYPAAYDVFAPIPDRHLYLPFRLLGKQTDHP